MSIVICLAHNFHCICFNLKKIAYHMVRIGNNHNNKKNSYMTIIKTHNTMGFQRPVIKLKNTIGWIKVRILASRYNSLPMLVILIQIRYNGSLDPVLLLLIKYDGQDDLLYPSTCMTQIVTCHHCFHYVIVVLILMVNMNRPLVSSSY